MSVDKNLQLSDEYIEYFPLHGSPHEVMEEFKDLVNERLARIESVYSPRWEAMLEKTVQAFWIETIDGQHFACIGYHTSHFKSREEFLGLEEE